MMTDPLSPAPLSPAPLSPAARVEDCAQLPSPRPLNGAGFSTVPFLVVDLTNPAHPSPPRPSGDEEGRHSPPPDRCPICLDCVAPGSPIAALGCGHAVHERCQRKWRRHGTGCCPVCRWGDDPGARARDDWFVGAGPATVRGDERPPAAPCGGGGCSVVVIAAAVTVYDARCCASAARAGMQFGGLVLAAIAACTLGTSEGATCAINRALCAMAGTLFACALYAHAQDYGGDVCGEELGALGMALRAGAVWGACATAACAGTCVRRHAEDPH